MITNHPLHTITPNECRKYYDAVIAFNSGFFQQYDKGLIVENDLILELKRTTNQVNNEKEKVR